MSSITRRTMVGGGMMMAFGALAPSLVTGAFGEEAPAVGFEPDADFVPGGGSFADPALAGGWTGTPADIARVGGSTMPLSEVNRRRQAYLDTQVDFVKEDGTVIPAVYVKMRALIHTYGMGCGKTPSDTAFDFIVSHFTEDEAQAYIDMPMGVTFTPFDFCVKSGRPIEECQSLCEMFAAAGFLIHGTSPEGDYYHHIPFFQGVVEYSGFVNRLSHEIDPAAFSVGIMGSDWLFEGNDMENSGTPTFYAIPLNEDIVSDGGGILPYDDIMRIIDATNNFAIAPCACRLGRAYKGGVEDLPTVEEFTTGEHEDYFSPLCNLRVETCLQLGEEADYWVERGFARKISKEDAKRFMRRSAEDGFILQSNFSKYSGTICSCHSATCNILDQWRSLGDADTIGSGRAFEQISHYTLEVDLDACVKCGACAERCPMNSITMDGEHNGEGGFPKVDAACFRCGQCAYICPASARKLAARPQEMNCELPKNFLDDSNMKAAYRFEHGVIF